MDSSKSVWCMLVCATLGQKISQNQWKFSWKGCLMLTSKCLSYLMTMTANRCLFGFAAMHFILLVMFTHCAYVFVPHVASLQIVCLYFCQMQVVFLHQYYKHDVARRESSVKTAFVWRICHNKHHNFIEVFIVSYWYIWIIYWNKNHVEIKLWSCCSVLLAWHRKVTLRHLQCLESGPTSVFLLWCSQGL